MSDETLMATAMLVLIGGMLGLFGFGIWTHHESERQCIQAAPAGAGWVEAVRVCKGDR